MKARLLAKGLPRLQMSLIVTCTGATGFLASFLLLHVGLRRLWLRYLIAFLLAYGAFLLLVRLWLFLQRRRLASSSGSGFDVDLGAFQIGGGSGGLGGGGGAGGSGGSFSGGGGSFGGGGATAFFDGSGADTSVANAAAASSSSSYGGSGFSFNFDLDGDELVLVVVVVAVVGAIVAASVYVVVAAPALFAEVLVDGTLTAGLYRHVKKLDEETWLEAAVKRTCIPFVVVGLFVVAAGVFFHRLAPEAASIGGVVRHVFGG